MRLVRTCVLVTLVVVSATSLSAKSAMARLSSVVDGNTLQVELRGKSVKVRMHGVAVPPADEARPILQKLNKEAAAFLAKYLSDGWVYLEFPDGDPVPDADGFVPAFVYRGSDAAFLNEKLVASGLAVVNKKEKNDFTAAWLKQQQGAEAARRGIWGDFESGDGERIASGVAQGNYIGVPGNQGNRRSYVTYWIFYYY